MTLNAVPPTGIAVRIIFLFILAISAKLALSAHTRKSPLYGREKWQGGKLTA